MKIPTVPTGAKIASLFIIGCLIGGFGVDLQKFAIGFLGLGIFLVAMVWAMINYPQT
jgi:hypothetical protein